MAQQDDFHVSVKKLLEGYSRGVQHGVQRSCSSYARNVMSHIRKNGPYGNREGKRGGRKVDQKRSHLRNSIRSIDEGKSSGGLYSRFVLHFADPNYRLAHLLEDGHIARDKASFVQGTHFVRKALEAERPKFDSDLKEAIEDA